MPTSLSKVAALQERTARQCKAEVLTHYIKDCSQSVRDAITMEGAHLTPTSSISRRHHPSRTCWAIAWNTWTGWSTPKSAWQKDRASLYERYLVSRMVGAVVAIDFILRALERIGTCSKLVLGKNIAILECGEAFYYPVGAMPSKDAKARRLAGNKQFLTGYVDRKSLGFLFAERLQDPWFS